MKIFNYRLVVTIIFFSGLFSSLYFAQFKEVIIYFCQFVMVSLCILKIGKVNKISLSLSFLLTADFFYYIMVYQFGFNTESGQVVLSSSFFYGASFCLITWFLVSQNLRKFAQISKRASELSILSVFVLISINYILIPGFQKFLAQGFNFGSLSNIISLLTSLPLVWVCYIFLTNSPSMRQSSPLIGFLILGVLDIGLQLETIIYGNLKFTLYDVLWFFGTYLISVSTYGRLGNYANLVESSLVNLVTKIVFISAMVPSFIIFVLIKSTFQISPMYFIFLVVSIFILGLSFSKVLGQKLDKYNKLLSSVVVKNQNINLEQLLINVPHEFKSSIVSVYSSVMNSELADLKSQKIKLIDNLSIYRRMAHDIASPLSVLEVISTVGGDFNKEKRDLLSLATQRVRNIAEDIILREKNSNSDLCDITVQLTTEEVSCIIRDILSEKEFEYQFLNANIKIEFFNFLNENLSVIAEKKELTRILSNLINNSKDALVNVVNPSISILAFTKQDSVVIRVCDNGLGFSPQVLEHRFDSPITELKVNGQGIGLFSTHKKILKWNGKFKIKNDMGAIVELTLFSPDAVNLSLMNAQIER